MRSRGGKEEWKEGRVKGEVRVGCREGTQGEEEGNLAILFRGPYFQKATGYGAKYFPEQLFLLCM